MSVNSDDTRLHRLLATLEEAPVVTVLDEGIAGSRREEVEEGGATVLTVPRDGSGLSLPDVLAALGVEATPPASPTQPDAELTDKERQVLESLSPIQPSGVEEIAAVTGLAISEILGALSTLELKECILADASRGYLRLAPARLLA